MTDVFGNGILVTDGTRWKKNRHILAPLFSVKSFQAIKFPSLLLVVTVSSLLLRRMFLGELGLYITVPQIQSGLLA
jgi:hypothetical protein